VTDPAPTPTLPASAYLDDDTWGREVRDVFRTGWVPVCRVDQIPESGDRYATSIAGNPVVAVRDGDDVRVLSNVCRHRWSLVADPGCSHGRNLVCPYHRWSYGLDGALQAAPLAGAFSLDGVALPEVRHEIWLGFVMVNLDGAAEPLGPQLAGLTEILAPWRMEELVTVTSRTYPSAWNWKVMVENWIECYHHLGSHRATVETRNPARTTRVTETDAPWTFMTVDTSPEAQSPPEGHAFPLDPTDAGHLTIWGVFPFLLGGNEADFSFWLEVTPRTVDGHHVTWHLLTSPANAERWEEGMAEAIMDALDVVHREDMAQCAKVDEGLRSGALITGRLVELEAPIVHFHRWLRGRLDGGGKVPTSGEY
jgi:phenylpropionate dioxygenase-like ring-hydroxylating dioxygenase large terminal subunit